MYIYKIPGMPQPTTKGVLHAM